MKLICGRFLGLSVRTAVGFAALVFLWSGTLAAADNRSASVEELLKGAEKVVVATARSVNARWEQNSHGDRLIVSRILLEIDEKFKGEAGRAVWLDLDGGTLDGLTLSVSSLPSLRPGERAVFFLNAVDGDVHTPHMRGRGILLLNERNVIQGSSLHLDEIRAKARSLGLR